MADSVATPELGLAFERAARRVRGRLWLRRVLSGASLGLLAGGAAAFGLWWLREGELRPFSAALGLLGATLGALAAARKRWSDEEVALFLDETLRSKEQLVTAVGLGGDTSEPARLLRARAASALQGLQLSGPKVLDALQWAGPLGAAAIIWMTLAPLPAAPKVVASPGVERVQQGDVKGLERIEALAGQHGRDPEDQRRLRALAEEAKRLRAELARGTEKREALAKMAKLRDAIAELRSEFGSQQNRPGLEAAIGALSEHPDLRKAARALGDGDLTAFDQEMQRLANKAEREARESAKEALADAARQAREKGAKALGEALEEQKRDFEKREREAQALRELAEALGSKLDAEALEDLKEFGSSGDPKAARRLAEAMGQALSKLSEEERKRLAEQLKKQAAQAPAGAASPMSREELEDLARRLASPEGQKELEQRLRELAEGEPGKEAERDGALGDAERGAEEAQRGLGAVPLPMQGEPGGKAGNAPPADGKAPPGGHGSGTDSGQGKQKGNADPVEAPELRAKANAKRTPNGPMHAATLGRAPARTGDTANQRGAGSLGSVAPEEIGAVEQSEVPEEYREHVGRYFEPE